MEWSKAVLFLLLPILTSQHPESDSNPVTTKLSDEESSRMRMVQYINNFGLKITNQLIDEEDLKNVVISPTNIAVLLAMTLLGAVGVTYDEIVASIGFSTDILLNQSHHSRFGTLLRELQKDQVKTLLANAVFADDNAKLRQLYQRYIENIYDGGVLNIDFGKGGEAQKIINEWASNHTEGKISNFLKEPLASNTKVVLLSALYFVGQWEKPFDINFTKEMEFRTENNTEIKVNMMLNYGDFKYVYDSELDCKMIAMPYKNTSTTMYIVKPRSKFSTLVDLLHNLRAEKLDSMISELQLKKAIIRLPKMKLHSDIKLRSTLEAIGVKTMFTPAANFGLMIEGYKTNNTDDILLTKRFGGEENEIRDKLSRLFNPGVYVESIIHEVDINIDEYGTEAAAVTGGVLPKSLQLFIADSPFYLFIRNEQTKLITFSAAIFDPRD